MKNEILIFLKNRDLMQNFHAILIFEILFLATNKFFTKNMAFFNNFYDQSKVVQN